MDKKEKHRLVIFVSAFFSQVVGFVFMGHYFWGNERSPPISWEEFPQHKWGIIIFSLILSFWAVIVSWSDELTVEEEVYSIRRDFRRVAFWFSVGLSVVFYFFLMCDCIQQAWMGVLSFDGISQYWRYYANLGLCGGISLAGWYICSKM